jgi:valyl-tRNA synthetase
MISGWGLAPQGAGKISKSKGGGPLSPAEMLEQNSADAVRYWAAGTGTGKDAIISQEKIAAGAKLVAKLWNVHSFSRRFLSDYAPGGTTSGLTAADRWILGALATLIDRCTDALENYDYATAKNDVENFFWHHLADNYLEMVKGRLYDDADNGRDAARYTLHHVVLNVLKLFAPFLPFVTDTAYRDLFSGWDGAPSIHVACWPEAEPSWRNAGAEEAGGVLLDVAAFVRRYKSERSMSLGAPIERLTIEVPARVLDGMRDSLADIRSVTRAATVELIPGRENGPRITVSDP